MMGRNNASNDVPARSVYGGMGGSTLGIRSTALSSQSLDRDSAGSASANLGATGGAVATGAATTAVVGGPFLGRPFSWFFVLIALLIGLMYTAKRFGGGEDFRNVKLSTYNIVVISMASIIGIGFFKALLGKYKIAGLSDFVLAV